MMDDDVWCDTCDFTGKASECSVNGDCDDDRLFTWLECSTEGCMGTIEEDK